MSRGLQAVTVALAIVCALVPVNPLTVEQAFSTGLYPAIQRHVTSVSNAAPFALFDVMTVCAALALMATLVQGIRHARGTRRWSALGPAAARIATGAAAGYLAFLALWGFNYRRVPMDARLVMEHGAPDATAVLALGIESARQLNALHAQAHAIGWSQEPWKDGSLLAAFAAVQAALSDAPAAVPGRVKPSIYGPYFRWTSVDGMVNPFALEVIANPDLLPFEQSFVAAHEWAHLAGYAHEAEANFVGWLTCLRGDRAAQYSGWLYLYLQVSGEVGSDVRRQMSAALDAGPRRDIQAIVDRIRAGQLPRLRNMSWRVYDQYLRANRVEEGIRSYGAVVNLILRARFEDGWTPVRRPSDAPAP